MIALYTNNVPPVLPHDWAGTYIASRIAAYGTQQQFAPVYTDDNGSVASVLDGNMIVCGDAVDVREWAAFISFQPCIHSVTAEMSIAKPLAECLHTSLHTKKVMRLQQAGVFDSEGVVAPSPRELYPLLSEVFGTEAPPFEGWYVDVSHRIRHGLCKTAGVSRDGMVVSTAMTVAETPQAVVIGAVATSPNYRRQGLAGRCIGKLIAESAGKAIMIAPKNENAERLYSNMGFAVCGEIGILNLDYSVD